MPGFNTKVSHTLGRDAAVKKLKGFMDRVQDLHPNEIETISGGWTENVLNFEFTSYGMKIDGTLTVEEELVKMDGNLPFAAMMFKGKISDTIRVALEKVISA